MIGGIVTTVTVAALALLGMLLGGWLWWVVRHGRPSRQRPPVLLYHKVTPRFDLSGTWTTPRQFEGHLRYLSAAGYRSMTLSEFYSNLEAGNPFPPRYVVVTFDDAYDTVFEHAFPLLQAYGFAATVFVIAGFVGRSNTWDVGIPWWRSNHLGWDELAEMVAGGCSVGSHTVTHMDLTRASTERAGEELSASKQMLEERLGVPVEFLSYPFGRYDERVVRLAKEAGYRGAVSSYPRARTSEDDPFALGRMGIYIIDTLADFKIKANNGANLFLFGLEEMKGRVINFCSLGTSLVKPDPSCPAPRARLRERLD